MIEKLLKKNKWIHFVLIVLIVLYVREGSLIMGIPPMVNFVILFISGIIALGILSYFSNRKKRNQALHFAKTKKLPEPKKKNSIAPIINFLGAVFLSFMVYVVLKLVFNFAVISHAQRTHLVRAAVPIDTYFSGRHKSVTFHFEGKQYNIPFDAKGISDDEIEKHYKLEFRYSRSYFNSAVIEDIGIIKK